MQVEPDIGDVVKLRFGLYILFSLIATGELYAKARGDIWSIFG